MKQDKENRFSGMTPEETRLEARRQIVRSTFLALAALIVIGVACYAWFVSSSVVTAILGPVSMGDMTFELASVGNLSAFDTPAGYTVPEGETYGTDSEKKWWTMGNQTIQWRMTGDANLGNFQNSEQNPAEGLRPGLSGNLSFYVIPRGDGPLTVRFNLSIVALKASDRDDPNSPLTALTDDSAASKLLRGHLLFACPQNYNNGTLANDPGMTLANYSDGSFTIAFGNVTADTPIRVTLNWFWPNTLADALASAYGETIKEWTTQVPAYFYYDYDNKRTPEIAVNSDLNKLFNDADLHIGDEIDAVILRLNATKAA